MAAKKNVKARVLLCQMEPGDDPFVVGAIDEVTYNALDEDDWQGLTLAWKRVLDPAVYSYEWREVWVTVPAEALKRVFEPRPIAAEVEA